jgi:hypothetical protein
MRQGYACAMNDPMACLRYGHVELFIDGIGEELRPHVAS